MPFLNLFFNFKNKERGKIFLTNGENFLTNRYDDCLFIFLKCCDDDIAFSCN